MRNLGSSDVRFRKKKKHEKNTDIYGQTPRYYKEVDGYRVSRKDSYDSEEEYEVPSQTSYLRSTFTIPPSNISSRESSRSEEASSMTNTSVLFAKNPLKDYGYSGRDDLESNPTVWDRSVSPRKRRPFVTIQRTRRSKDWLNRNRKFRPLFPERRYCNRFSNSFVNLRNYRKSSGSDYGEECWNRNSATENSVCYGNGYKYKPPVRQWMVTTTDQETTDSEMPRSDQAVAGSEATVSDISKYMNMEFFEGPKRFSPKPSRGKSYDRSKSQPPTCNRVSCNNSYKNLSERMPEELNKYLDSGMATVKRFSSKRKVTKPKIQMKFPKLYPGKSYPCDSRCEGLANSYSAENDIVLKNIEYQKPDSSYDTLAEKEENNWDGCSDSGGRCSLRRCGQMENVQEFHTDYDPFTTQKGPKKRCFKPRYDSKRKVKIDDPKSNEGNFPKIYNRDNIIYTELNRYPVCPKYEAPALRKSEEGLKNKCNITYTAKKVSSSEKDNCSRLSMCSSKQDNCLPLYHDSSYDVKKGSCIGAVESLKPKMKRVIQSNQKGCVVKNQSFENSFGVDAKLGKTKRCVKSQQRNCSDTRKFARECYDQGNYVWESSHRSCKAKRLPTSSKRTNLETPLQTGSKSSKTKQCPVSFHKVTFDSQVSYAGEGNKKNRRKMGGAEVFSHSFKEYDGLVSDPYCPSECIK